eukprot:7453052-Pyramimonas_sp.AAC.2
MESARQEWARMMAQECPTTGAMAPTPIRPGRGTGSCLPCALACSQRSLGVTSSKAMLCWLARPPRPVEPVWDVARKGTNSYSPRTSGDKSSPLSALGDLRPVHGGFLDLKLRRRQSQTSGDALMPVRFSPP